jgi:hypothetical protein
MEEAPLQLNIAEPPRDCAQTSLAPCRTPAAKPSRRKEHKSFAAAAHGRSEAEASLAQCYQV